MRAATEDSSADETDAGTRSDYEPSEEDDEAGAQPLTLNEVEEEIGSEAEIDEECRWFAVPYDPPTSAEVRDLDGQSVARGTKTRKARRDNMAKKCRIAAKARSTTRQAAKELRSAQRRAAPAAAAPAESSVAALAESTSHLHLEDEGLYSKQSKTWEYTGQLSDDEQKKLALVQAEWQLGRWAALFNRLVYQPSSWFCSSHLIVVLPERQTAAQLSQILFAADWQPATFSPEKWAELVRSCELAGGFVCDETHQGKAKPASTSDARAQPEMGWLSLASIGVQDPIWTLPVEDEPDSYELMSPVSLEEENAAYIARLGIPIKDLWVMFGPTPGDPGDIRPVRSEKSMQELMRESNNTMFRESGNMLRVSNNGTRFPPGLLHEQVEGLLQACEDSLEAKPWVEWEADDQASARDHQRSRFWPRPYKEGDTDRELDTRLSPTALFYYHNRGCTVQCSHRSTQGEPNSLFPEVQPVYDGRNYTEPAVYGPYPTKEMRMLFEKTSAGSIRHVGEHIDSETLVAVCESDEVEYVGPGDRDKLEYEGTIDYIGYSYFASTDPLDFRPVHRLWEDPQTQAFDPHATWRAMHAAAPKKVVLARLHRSRRERLFCSLFEAAGIPPPLEAARFLRLLGCPGPTGVGPDSKPRTTDPWNKRALHSVDRVDFELSDEEWVQWFSEACYDWRQWIQQDSTGLTMLPAFGAEIVFSRPQLASAIHMVEVSAGLTGREKAELIAKVSAEYAAPIWSPEGARTFAFGDTRYNPLKRRQAASTLPGAA